MSGISIDFYRGEGARRGDDIVDPLIGSVPCALSRGRNELDARAHPRDSVRVVIPHRPNLRLGQLAALTGDGRRRVGLIVGIAHNLSDGKLLTTLTLDCPEI
ncbi:MAG: hypothetical protein HQL51_01685 [Magnetococcales bacterium]|nr:hypothetical protein [Magnetococcales bacterium]